MKARATDTSTQNGNDTADGYVHDLSILRKPIQTTVTGFNEAMKAYKDGTEEIKKLLANECDIIYECKACRNIFRSLANFISHKRIYCKNNFNSAHHFHFRHDGCIEQDISTIIQAEQQDHSKHTSGSKEKNQDKDLGSIIDRLVRREQNNRLMKLGDFYDQANHNLTQEEILEKKQVLQLDKVANSKIAVFQTLKKDGTDDIKKEVNEVHDLMKKDNTVLGPDGKVVTNSNATVLPKSLSATKSPVKVEHQCKICSEKFATEKTLRLHLKAKHISSTYVYPCPSCLLTFMQPSAVIRHLSNDHKKSMRRIRLMRDAIFRRRTRIDEIPVKGPSRELARLQADKERNDQLNKYWQEKIEVSEATSTCSYCGKTFERRAALITHAKNCAQKLKSDAAKKDSSDSGGPSKELDEDSSSSLESFLKMLNREKLIQATVESTIAKEEEENGRLINEFVDTILIKKEDEDKTVEPNGDESDVVVKNKRKRNRTRKAEAAKSSVTDEDEMNNIFWNMDDDGNLSIVKSDPVNGDCLINVTSSDIATIKSEESDKILPDKTTDCTICAKKFANISNLRRHVAMFHYRQKKYGCKLCDMKAFRKFDIINHLSSAHSISNGNDEALPFVILLEIDKNKFNEEKALAVAEALLKLQDKEKEKSQNGVGSTSGYSTLTPGHDESVDETIVKEEANEPNTSTDNSNMDFEDSQPINETVKKRGRPRIDRTLPKSSAVISDSETISRRKTQKLSRNSSSNSLNDDSYAAKRPVRNRIKAVNKDFVYDLSNLLRKDTDTAVGVKQQKRKLSTSPPYENGKDETPNLSSVKRIAFSDIKGAANAMAKIAVQNNRACFNKPPEIPTERPIIPSKMNQLRRSENTFQDWQLLEQQKPQSSPHQTLASEIIERHIRRNSLGKVSSIEVIENLPLVKRRRLSKKSSTSSSTTPVAVSTSQDESDKKSGDDDDDDDAVAAAAAAAPITENKIVVKCPTEKEFQQYLVKNRLTEYTRPILVSVPNKAPPPLSNNTVTTTTLISEPSTEPSVLSDPQSPTAPSSTSTSTSLTVSTAPITTSTPKSSDDSDTNQIQNKSQSSIQQPTTTPSILSNPKRITLLQRLTDNKNRKLQESLLKMNVFENGIAEKSN